MQQSPNGPDGLITSELVSYFELKGSKKKVFFLYRFSCKDRVKNNTVFGRC